ncbi:MAG: phosphonate ABC transporter ATP-binding protein, partial [Betaproteobacteria bacterium]|nr:phosphonate ABC transporter ATP-binding protein [Betaproteobacteria bacterium]
IMRLVCELCAERRLAAVINIHDVQLAQLFVQRVVGLRAGKVVFDGAPSALSAEVLTRIYGEEDWTAAVTRGAQGDGGDDALDEERLAGMV